MSVKPATSVFISATMRLIDENSPSRAVRWSDSGNSFVIESTEEFFKLLPVYFKTRNFSSFVRQLNMYGFRKVKNAKGFQEFKHPLFRQGSADQLYKIQRKSNEQNSSESETKPRASEPGPKLLETERPKVEFLPPPLDIDSQVAKLTYLLYLATQGGPEAEAVATLFTGRAPLTRGRPPTLLRRSTDEAARKILDPRGPANEVLRRLGGEELVKEFEAPLPQNNASSVTKSTETPGLTAHKEEQKPSFLVTSEHAVEGPTPFHFNFLLSTFERADSFSMVDKGSLKIYRRPNSIVPTPHNELN